ncbi:MAG TPA: hypothetical protein VE869_01860 [Gemmatimonas sp.]|nr:hypothetical protein [Gemmatimonas sp.]
MTTLRMISPDEVTSRTIRVPVTQTVLVAVAALIGATIVADGAAAQESPDRRWTPYVGCWAPPATDATNATIGLSRSGSDANSGMREAVCVIPTASPNIVQVVSIVNGRKIAGETVDASGTRVAKSVDGCTGWETANWSGDGNRLLLRSEFKCPNDLLRKSSGVFSMSNDGSWIDVEGIDVNGASGVRVIRLRDMGVDGDAFRTIAAAAVGDAVTLSTSGRLAMVSQSMRLAASTPADADDIFEVARAIDLPVAQAWLAGLDQQFEVDARRLTLLADAGLPGSMLDLIVAKAYPKNFAIGARGAEPERVERGSRGNNSFGNFDRARLTCANNFPFGYSMGAAMFLDDPCLGGPFFGRSLMFGGLGFNSFGFNRLGFNQFGVNPYGGFNPYFGGPPIIITNPGNGGNAPARTQGARAVRGEGYTRDSGPSSRPASTQGTGSTGGGAARSSGEGGGGGGAGAVRTAKPKGGGE